MKYGQKKIGILGFGVVGRSVLSFLEKRKKEICQKLFGQDLTVIFTVWVDSLVDGKISSSDHELLKRHSVTCVSGAKKKLELFLREQDYVISSPGFNLNAYHEYDDKILCELDLFDDFSRHKTIAVTGTLGKTTVVKLIDNLLKQVGIRSCLAGNVGTGMLDLVACDTCDLCQTGVLELSSFQLERSKKFAPDIALWTNFYANHLDRHDTEDAYFKAKINLLKYQDETQWAIMPVSLFQGRSGRLLGQYFRNFTSQLCVVCVSEHDKRFCDHALSENFLTKKRVVYVYDNCLYDRDQKIFDMTMLPSVTFKENWVMVLATLYIYGADLSRIERYLCDKSKAQGALLLNDHAHRLEFVAAVQGVSFYNDSKATVGQATERAVARVAREHASLIVILGGQSKGVDRSDVIKRLSQNSSVKKIYCFGPECEHLGFCHKSYDLCEIIDLIFRDMKSGDCVLFSPGGSSFDLFDNYKHRGNFFKELVLKRSAQVS